MTITSDNVPTIPTRNATLSLAHTSALSPATRLAARALLDDVFDGLDDTDWDHALGGVHALLHDGDELIGHAAVIPRRLLHGGRALRCGYVEGVGVRADRRGQGHGATLMTALEHVVRQAYELGALSASDTATGFYAARDWHLWRGPSSALTPAGIRPTPDEDGSLYVLPVSASLDPDAPLTCDWRDGDVW
ncbi:GNAT family N-acetyltransferase [Streptomyces ramulosus]|uniref:GNAT family N-acetyltransferase n=1 Tax=Streptomyces ramulosus TaxID=47762 RepID=A0ABW1FSJ2_9ACTN